jgi:hypothetical protein
MIMGANYGEVNLKAARPVHSEKPIGKDDDDLTETSYCAVDWAKIGEVAKPCSKASLPDSPLLNR